MFWIIVGILGALFISILILVIMLGRTREGWEDERGFHPGRHQPKRGIASSR